MLQQETINTHRQLGPSDEKVVWRRSKELTWELIKVAYHLTMCALMVYVSV